MWEQIDNNTYVRKGVLEQVDVVQLDEDIAALKSELALWSAKLAKVVARQEGEEDQDILDGLALVAEKYQTQVLHLELTLSEKEALKQSING